MSISSSDRRKQILYQLLEGKILTRTSLSEVFEVSEKTIQRDMDTLRNWRWPIESSSDGYHLRSGSAAEKNPYPNQFLALILLTNGTIDQTIPLLVPEQVRQLKRSLLNIQELDELNPQAIQETLSLHHTKLSDEMLAVIGKIAKAILSKQCISFHYTPLMQDKGMDRQVYPLQLRERDSNWYLCAYDTYFKSIRTYSLPRAENVQFSTYTEEIPENDYLHEFLTEDNFGIWADGSSKELIEVKIKFFNEAARLIQERTYHDSQKLEIINRDEVIATFQVSEFWGIKLWLRKFINQSEILSPPPLREEIIKDLKEGLEYYS